MNNTKNDTKLVVLGGLGEVGKNMYCVVYEDEIIIIDSGVSFPDEGILGIDYVIPDYTYLKENQEKIKALIITHGHEDHIGGIPFLLQAVNIPNIYAPNHASKLISLKLQDRNIRYDNLHTYNDETVIKLKHMTVEFFRVTHSIPDPHGVLIKTPNGNIVTTGDFKFDLTPIGPMSDLYKMAKIGTEGVDLLISDSTNALNEGVSLSEAKVDTALNDIFKKYPTRRLIIATFASNIYRLKHIVETCYTTGRKLCVFGRSMENNIKISLEGGYINHPEVIITPEEANNLKPGETVILCTGSQGEPLAALSRMAAGTHRQIKLRPEDVVVFSSSPIPGNALSIGNIVNKLYLNGVKVLTNQSFSELHTSGHANQEELKWMIRLIQPTHLMPFHGNYRMLKTHANIGEECGIDKNNIFVLQNGDVLSLKDHKITKDKPVTASDVYVGNNKLEEINTAVLRDRKIMSNDGILVVIANIDIKKKKLMIKPNITTRGFILINENEQLLKKIELTADRIIKNKLEEQNVNFNDIKGQLTLELFPYIFELTGRRPIILPILLDIKA